MREVILLIFCVFNIHFLSAQDFANSTCAVHKFQSYPESEFYKNLDDIDVYSVKENVKLDRTKRKLQKMLAHAAFEELQKTFKEKYNIHLDKDLLKDKVYYDDLGYPSALLKKAVKKGDADYYFSFNVTFNNGLDFKSAMLKTKQIKPIVIITMTIGDKSGTKIFNKIKGEAKAAAAIKSKDLGGGRNLDLTEEKSAEILAEPLIELIKQATFNLTENFTPKS